MLNLKRSVYFAKWYKPVFCYEIMGDSVLAGYYVLRGNYLVRRGTGYLSSNYLLFVTGSTYLV